MRTLRLSGNPNVALSEMVTSRIEWRRMTAAPYKVYVVVDREFGEQLADLEQGAPVWIVDTPTNKPVAQRLWKGRTGKDHLSGITTFEVPNALSPEDMLFAELNTIDLHHGPHSADPPYTVIEVVGAPLTTRAKAALSEYGFNEFHAKPKGFTARRLVPLD